MQSHQVITMLRAVDHTLRSPIMPRVPVSLPILYSLVQLCQQLGTWGIVLKCAILFCFFGFLRQSNVAPRSLVSFDPTRDTLRTDVVVKHNGLLLNLKWTKTLQGAHRPITIHLPRIQGSVLCPTQAFVQMVSTQPAATVTTPLLMYQSRVVTTRLLAREFQRLIRLLGLPPSTYTLHSLRKGGATLCHSLGLPLDQIKAHGTWSSDAVYTYLHPSHGQPSVVATAMTQAVLTSDINK
jgi:hypothetical protein